MIELLLESLMLIARWDVAIALLIGAIGGVIIGAIPGVGPAVAIAILLPATYKLEPLVGLTVLLGIYGAALYGGAIPAILINTPGTPVNALTTYDGHPIARRGEPRRALSLAYSASFIGGIISVLALIFLTPKLAAVAPYFGSRDILMAALLGLILVILTHRGQTLAAAALVGMGVFITVVGMEPVRFSDRFVFPPLLVPWAVCFCGRLFLSSFGMIYSCPRFRPRHDLLMPLFCINNFSGVPVSRATPPIFYCSLLPLGAARAGTYFRNLSCFGFSSPFKV